MPSLLIAAVSLLLSRVHPSFDALVVSILLGMLISNGLANRDFLAGGIDRMLRFALPVGIALYGTQLTFSDTIGYGKSELGRGTIVAVDLPLNKAGSPGDKG